MRGRLAIILAALLVAPGAAPAATHHTLRWRVNHLEHRLHAAMNLIDAQEDRISELEHTARCTAWLEVDPASYLLPGPTPGVPVWTGLLIQTDGEGTYELPVTTAACMESDD